jgi:class 3 adenylate cyclase
MSAPKTKNLTILLTDIKGFTDKTSHRSRADIQLLLDQHQKVVLPILEGKGGRLVKTMGDAFLMTFESPTDAVLAGVAVQWALWTYNKDKAPDDRIEIRIAINQGEVNLSDNDVFGEPVNITARIEAVVEAGEVYFTEAVYLSMNKQEVPSSEVGLLQLKGIPEKVRVYKVRREQSVESAASAPGEVGSQKPPAEPEAPPSPATPAPAGAHPGPWRLIAAVVFGALLCALVVALARRHAKTRDYSTGVISQETPAAQRFSARGFPSVFQVWMPLEDPNEDKLTALSRHDLVIDGPYQFKLKWDDPHAGLSSGFTPESIATGRLWRGALLARNPNMILVLHIPYHDNPEGYLPAEHRWWKRDAQGRRLPGWKDHFLLALEDPGFQDHIAKQCQAALQSGVVDGCMFDWWQDDSDHVALLQKVRSAVGDDAILIVGANDREIPLSAPYVNGDFMQITHHYDKTPADWGNIAQALASNQMLLREPKMTCLALSWQHSRSDLILMRLATTLSLTQSDGYVLFADPEGLATPANAHIWYPFWNKSLGKATGKGQRRADGATLREFEMGTVVYNPMGNGAVRLHFAEGRTSAASLKRGRDFELPGADGDIYLR